MSAKTLGFDFLDAAKLLVPITRAVHISDNDGKLDLNNFFNAQSDVLNALKLFGHLDFITVEVYCDVLKILQDQIKLVQEYRKK